MENKFIPDNNNPWYSQFKDIYTYSFPVHEQRTEEQQQKAFMAPQYHLEIATEDNIVLSFISYWEFDTYIYIEHLAVNRDFRGKNLGSRFLNKFTKQHSKTVLLEIDPLIDDISRKRFEFYKRNGFTDNPYTHHHPPYRPGFEPHELIVLSYGKTLSLEEYEQFRRDLEDIVMV